MSTLNEDLTLKLKEMLDSLTIMCKYMKDTENDLNHAINLATTKYHEDEQKDDELLHAIIKCKAGWVEADGRIDEIGHTLQRALKMSDTLCKIDQKFGYKFKGVYDDEPSPEEQNDVKN